jgi:hypothetical protein
VTSVLHNDTVHQFALTALAQYKPFCLNARLGFMADTRDKEPFSSALGN